MPRWTKRDGPASPSPGAASEAPELELINAPSLLVSLPVVGCRNVFEPLWVLAVVEENWPAVTTCDITVSGRGLGRLRNHGNSGRKVSLSIVSHERALPSKIDISGTFRVRASHECCTAFVDGTMKSGAEKAWTELRIHSSRGNESSIRLVGHATTPLFLPKSLKRMRPRRRQGSR